jgi:rSAM/selenodomain-associated transferase 1
VSERLLIFTRLPVAGRVKTRLVPALGAEGAASLHQRLAERTLETAHRFLAGRQTVLEIWFDGGTESETRAWLGEGPAYHRQVGNDLGQRMGAALAHCFPEGVRCVVLVGTDCPDLSVAILEKAFAGLQNADVVLGPAEDGGYYLIGLRQDEPRLFKDISWGSNLVLEQTMEAIAQRGLAVLFLPTLADIDRPADLAAWPGLGP